MCLVNTHIELASRYKGFGYLYKRGLEEIVKGFDTDNSKGEIRLALFCDLNMTVVRMSCSTLCANLKMYADCRDNQRKMRVQVIISESL